MFLDFLLRKKCETSDGDKGVRTLDPLLAKQVLSQLSYTPTRGIALPLCLKARLGFAHKANRSRDLLSPVRRL